ncbi:cation-translocating P-type ATPase [Sporomusa sp.]|uniref:heavy metal translocating P-type ATPase n=1 Tax=Sporomusa sp. TaxID=2078658 RepID=UPI002D1247B3|nr:cation-translocating P-type ATPase [Sporomusa sp.]HWR41906.1 cation-translocating P-type ATPase [Sporomusa sp.]
MSQGYPQIVHKLPGRIRVYMPQIRCNPRLASQLDVLLREQNGVKECTANPKSGKVLIYYDRGIISEQALCSLIHRVSCEIPVQKTATVEKIYIEKKKPFELEDMSIPTQIALVVLGGLGLLYHLFHHLRRRGPLSLVLERQLSLLTLITAIPILRSGLESLFLHRKLNNEILIGSATVLSLLLREGATGLVVVWLVNLSTLIETLTLDKSRRTIRAMLEGNQKNAWIVVDGQEVLVPIPQLQENDTVSVKLGSKIPVDGTVVDGEAVVNQAALTGEPIPVYKHQGDRVLAGSTIEQGTLYIRAERVGDQTSVARIIHLVEQATQSRAPIQTMADKYSARIIPASFLLALIVFLLTRDIRRTMTILIVACPCAAGLATPTALSAAIGNAASRGILVKGGRYLEEAGKINCLLFDKTGTLTEGKPTVVEVVPVNQGHDANSILALAAAAEANANHPLADAIKQAAENQGIKLPCIPNSEMTIGRGVKATVNGTAIYVGNSLYLSEIGIKIPPPIPVLIRDLEQNSTLVYVASETQVIGIIAIKDALRKNAVKAIRDIRSEGVIDIGIVSGDTDAVVKETASHLGIDRVWSNMLPQEKFELVKSLKDEGHVVGMVGDGVNDSPSLALANVGIAMGVGGADAAIETAGIVLREDNPEKIVEVIRLGKRSLLIIRQNFLFAIGANIIGLGLGSAKLISPFLAAILHNASTLAVVLNSTRLLSYAPDRLNDEHTLCHTEKDRYTLTYEQELPVLK